MGTAVTGGAWSRMSVSSSIRIGGTALAADSWDATAAAVVWTEKYHAHGSDARPEVGNLLGLAADRSSSTSALVTAYSLGLH